MISPNEFAAMREAISNVEKSANRLKTFDANNGLTETLYLEISIPGFKPYKSDQKVSTQDVRDFLEKDYHNSIAKAKNLIDSKLKI